MNKFLTNTNFDKKKNTP